MNNNHNDLINVEQLVNNSACEKHRKAVNRGTMARIGKLFTGKNSQLTNFDDLYASSQVKQERDAGAQAVAIEQISGSMSNSQGFDRDFNPISGHNGEVWLKYARTLENNGELPAVELVKVGDSYFVLDGHHRISVAKTYRRAFIDAQVIELDIDFVPQRAIARTQPVTAQQSPAYSVAVE